MTQMLVYDCLVTLCCGRMEGLLAVCQGAFVGDVQTLGGLKITMKGKNGFLTIPIFYCPHCGGKIMVKQVKEG